MNKDSKNKKSVLFLITKGNWGGAQKYVYEIATSLPKEKYNPLVAHGEGNILPQKLKQQDIKTVHIQHLKRDVGFFNDLRSFVAILSLLRSHRPDIVHLNSSKIGGIGALAARLCGIKKIVFTAHGFAFNEDRPQYQKKIITLISWCTLLLATDTICITHKEYKHVANWPLVSKKIHLIYNGIIPPTFLDKQSARQELQLAIKQPLPPFPLVGTIAELTKNKNISLALEALSSLPQIGYLVIGAGEEKKILEEKINIAGLSDRVFLCGFIPDASKYIKAFDIFLLPSKKEGMPYVLIEAGFATIPVIATNVGGIPEILDNGSAGRLIQSDRPDLLANDIRELLANNSMRELYAKKLHTQVTKRHALSAMITDTQTVYEK